MDRRAHLTLVLNALIASAFVAALAVPVLTGCTIVPPPPVAQPHETAQSGRAGSEAGKLSQQEVQSTLQKLLQVLPRFVEQLGLEQGLAEYQRRIHVVLGALALAGGAASDAYSAYWNEYGKVEYERVANLARQGDAEAQYTLAMYYGLGASSDHIKAAEWLLKSAKQGHLQAQLILGHERYFRQDYAEAVKWFRKAAEQGVAAVQSKLGDMYWQGEEGLPQDYAEAAHWYLRAAQQGSGLSSPWSQYNLGLMYAEGKGVHQDDAKAVKWWRKAAEQGGGYAQARLGVMYGDGRGLSQDYAEAVKWFRKAVEQGVAEARLGLGIMYDKGLGVPQDYAQAHMWYNLAASRYPPGEARDARRAARAEASCRAIGLDPSSEKWVDCMIVMMAAEKQGAAARAAAQTRVHTVQPAPLPALQQQLHDFEQQQHNQQQQRFQRQQQLYQQFPQLRPRPIQPSPVGAPMIGNDPVLDCRVMIGGC